ncbi:hypothetical protein C8F01DRAFT_1361670 [Mycena amicta]|nr:hypothetical protein C8F01DRAFT_1361670 [Mycena amicta]
MAAPAQFVATRNANNCLELYLSPTQPILPVPSEIREEISDEAWGGRTQMLTSTASRFNKVWLERIWLLVGICSIFIVPVVLFPVILNALHVRDDVTASHVFEARGIAFALFVALLALFFVPIAVWKFIGQQHVNALLKKWAQEDAARHGGPLSTWTVKTPGVFRSSTILRIQLPAGKAVSAFTFGAYLPSYVGAAADTDANYFYPYKPAPGLPRMSVVGNVPLFNDEKRGFYGTEKV